MPKYTDFGNYVIKRCKEQNLSVRGLADILNASAPTVFYHLRTSKNDLWRHRILCALDRVGEFDSQYTTPPPPPIPAPYVLPKGTYTPIGASIMTALHERGMTQGQLSEAVGVSRQVINYMIHNIDCNLYGPKAINKVCEYLGIGDIPMNKNSYTPFGQEVIKRCIQQNIFLKDLESSLGLSQKYLYFILTGRVSDDVWKDKINSALDGTGIYKDNPVLQNRCYTELGKKIALKLFDKGLTSSQYCQQLDISRSLLSHIMTGDIKRSKYLKKICEGLDIAI